MHFDANDTDSTVFGDRHGDNHIDSEFIRISISSNQLQSFETSVPVRVNEPGTFSVVAGLEFFLSNTTATSEPVYLATIANVPIQDNIVQYQNEPNILYTTANAEIVSYAMIGLVGSIMLYLLYYTVKYRKEQALLLAQGYFLIAMLCTGIVTIVGTLFFNPKNDLYCKLFGPMLILPAYVFFSIILARLWRIHAVISPLLLLTLEREESLVVRACNFVNRITTCSGDPKKLRRKVTNAQLARVVLLLASPQIIVQVLALALNQNELTVQFDDTMTNGSVICDAILNYGWPEVCSAVLMALQFAFMWILARQSRDLPSLFNEAAVIFDVTLVSVILMAVCVIVMVMINGPTTSPDIQYIIGVLGTLAVIMNASVKLVLPKLRMVWRGDIIVVTKLLADHQKFRNSGTVVIEEFVSASEFREEDDASDSSSVVLVDTCVESPIDSEIDLEELRDTSEPLTTIEELGENKELGDSMQDFLTTEPLDGSGAASPNDWGNHVNYGVNSEKVPSRPSLADVATHHSNKSHHMRSKRTIFSGFESSKQTLFAGRGDHRHGLNSVRNGMFSAVQMSVRNLTGDVPKGKMHHSVTNFAIDYNPRADDKIIVTEDETPARRLLLRMVDVQRLLTQANRTVLGGRILPKEDWELLKEAVVELGGVFEDDVEFAWQADQPSSGTKKTADSPLSKSSSRSLPLLLNQPTSNGQAKVGVVQPPGSSQGEKSQPFGYKTGGTRSTPSSSQRLARQMDQIGTSASMKSSSNVPWQKRQSRSVRFPAQVEASQKSPWQGGRSQSEMPASMDSSQDIVLNGDRSQSKSAGIPVSVRAAQEVKGQGDQQPLKSVGTVASVKAAQEIKGQVGQSQPKSDGALVPVRAAQGVKDQGGQSKPVSLGDPFSVTAAQGVKDQGGQSQPETVGVPVSVRAAQEVKRQGDQAQPKTVDVSLSNKAAQESEARGDRSQSTEQDQVGPSEPMGASLTSLWLEEQLKFLQQKESEEPTPMNSPQAAISIAQTPVTVTPHAESSKEDLGQVGSWQSASSAVTPIASFESSRARQGNRSPSSRDHDRKVSFRIPKTTSICKD